MGQGLTWARQAAEKSLEKLEKNSPDIIFIYMDEASRKKSCELAASLRQNGLRCCVDYNNRSVKAQMRLANRLKARFALVLGKNELQKQAGQLKNMVNGEQKEVSIVPDALLKAMNLDGHERL